MDFLKQYKKRIRFKFSFEKFKKDGDKDSPFFLIWREYLNDKNEVAYGEILISF